MRQEMKFGVWLKIRRVAAELTPMDLARHLGVDLATYREIEADKHGVTESQLLTLAKLEKLKMTERDLRARATIVAEKPGTPAPEPQKKAVSSPLDALVASVAAKHERDLERQAKARPPLALYLDEACARLALKKGQLAAKCQITLNVLEDIERGFTPGPAILAKLADGLGVPVSELTALG
jgi:transcriptional regulator with XRE-family HTH domain